MKHNILKRIVRALVRLFKREILRDSFLLEAKRWVHDKGDINLRLDYPLSEQSVVIDLGGYRGDFTARMVDLFNATVYLFEPVPKFYQECVKRFENNDKIKCLNYGLSSKNGNFKISDSDDASSFLRKNIQGGCIQAELRSVVEIWDKLGLEKIDLIKINIEGGEYDILPALIQSGLIKKIKYIQVQFHNFIDDAEIKRKQIRESLSQTHSEMWCYKFVWESWQLK